MAREAPPGGLIHHARNRRHDLVNLVQLVLCPTNN
jgi:hypothetical protein